MNGNNIISKRINDCLQVRNMMASELAKRIGVSKSTMSYYLSGRFEPKRDKMFSIAKVFGVSPYWLMGGDETSTEMTSDVQRLVNAYCNASEEGKAIFMLLADKYLKGA